MSKYITWVVILIIAVAAVFGYFVYKQKSGTPSHNPSANTNSNGSAFSSVEEAIMKNMSINCDYTDQNGVHVTAYIKSGQVRVDTSGSNANQDSHTIIKDKTIYFWNNQEAFKMAEPQVTPSVSPTGSGNAQNTVSNLEAYKSDCKNANVDDSLFTLPPGVTFTAMTVPTYPTTGAGYTGGSTGTGGGYAVPTQYMQYYHQSQSQTQYLSGTPVQSQSQSQ